MIWDAFKDLFISDITGSYVLISLFFLLLIWGVLLLIRAREEVFAGVTTFYVYYLTTNNIFPRWSFFLVILLSGIIMTKSLIKIFFNS